jgi:serine/threonine protein kinase
MYQKFWNQFLIEQSEPASPTFNVSDVKPTKPDPPPARSYPSPFTTGVGAYLLSKGYDLDSKLGGGNDGEVYAAINKKTGQKVAVKFVPRTGRGDMDKEKENYKFIKDNREALGKYAKHFPIVFSSTIDDVPLKKEPIDGMKVENAVIFMEELEPLPDIVARSLFPASGHGEKTTRARQLRDEKLLSNPKLVENFLGLVFTSLEYSNAYLPTITVDMELEVIPKIIEEFFTSNKSFDTPAVDERVSITKKGKRLMSLFIYFLFNSMKENAKDDEEKSIIIDYQQNIKQTLMNMFLKTYARSLVSGGVGDAIKPYSILQGMDQYALTQSELEDEFPETVSIRAAMKELGMIGLKPFDVHIGNVMMRPITNEIVIVDLGRFKK